MSGVLNRFNWLARLYDSAARLVFGDAIFKSQICFLPGLPAGCHLLILGGGAGEILPHLMRINPTCRICYIEASSRMLSLAERKVSGEEKTRIEFIHGTERSLPEGVAFDVMITNFLVDIYPNQKALELCRLLSRRLRQEGKWLATDFVDNGRWWQKAMLMVMYRFFVLTCGIEATSLPAWEEQLRTAGLRETESASFFGGFIKSAVYTKA